MSEEYERLMTESFDEYERVKNLKNEIFKNTYSLELLDEDFDDES